LSTDFTACELAREVSAAVGRDPSNDLVIDDPLVSRPHARVDYFGRSVDAARSRELQRDVQHGERVDAVALISGVLAQLGHPENGP